MHISLGFSSKRLVDHLTRTKLRRNLLGTKKWYFFEFFYFMNLATITYLLDATLIQALINRTLAFGFTDLGLVWF